MKKKKQPQEIQKTDSKLKAATIGFYHQNCQTSISTEKFPHITLEQVSPVVYFRREKDWMDYSLIWNVKAEKESELEEYLNYIKKRNDTKRLSILNKSGTEALILLRFKSPSSSYEKVLESGTIPTSPVIAKEGFETYNLLAINPKGIKNLSKELDAIGDVKMMRVGEYKNSGDLPSLTHKQKDALIMAMINGYYKWPKSTNLEKLAELANISRRSMQERLRRAESKLFPHLIKKHVKKGEK